jgi:hypothetical protein
MGSNPIGPGTSSCLPAQSNTLPKSAYCGFSERKSSWRASDSNCFKSSLGNFRRTASNWAFVSPIGRSKSKPFVYSRSSSENSNPEKVLILSRFKISIFKKLVRMKGDNMLCNFLPLFTSDTRLLMAAPIGSLDNKPSGSSVRFFLLPNKNSRKLIMGYLETSLLVGGNPAGICTPQAIFPCPVADRTLRPIVYANCTPPNASAFATSLNG